MAYRPFVIRSSEGVEIARLTYLQKSAKNYLSYNGTVTDVRWTRNIAQKFVITVDFTTLVPTTSLSIDGVPVAGAQVRSFVGAATNLHRVQAEFGGIDSGTMGWDNIEIERIPDK